MVSGGGAYALTLSWSINTGDGVVSGGMELWDMIKLPPVMPAFNVMSGGCRDGRNPLFAAVGHH